MWLLLTLACQPWTDGDFDRDGFRFPRDCDDGDERVHPGAPDPVGDAQDSNCDGLDGIDADADGTASTSSGGADCADDNPLVHPLAVEVCNGLDDDCDGTTDQDAVDGSDWFADGDGDGVGAGPAVDACELPATGWSNAAGDCDDQDANRHPGAVEPCGLDLDCDGYVRTCPALNGEIADGLVFVGPAAGAGTGWSVAAVGDVDGDGWPDVAVGARELGQAWVLAGPFGRSETVVNSAVLSLTGSVGAGVSVAGLGDVNSDGYDDVLIGADADPLGGENAGAAWLVHGSTLREGTFSTSALQLIGEQPGDYAGRAVAGPGDVDGDGVHDLLIGAPGAKDAGGVAVGAVYLVSGTVDSNLSLRDADLTLEAGEDGAGAGWAVAGADVDGDGLGDMVVGGPLAGAGQVWVVHGDAGGVAGLTMLLDAGSGRYTGQADGDKLGWALSTGDADGDGRADIWVGAPGTAEARGQAWLILGTAGVATGEISAVATASVAGQALGEELGQSVSFVPDVDGDGLDELAVVGTGAATNRTADGSLWVFMGPAAGHRDVDDADAWMSGAHTQDALGAGLDAADLNQDGVGDLLIGVPGGGVDGQGPGELLVIYGG